MIAVHLFTLGFDPAAHPQLPQPSFSVRKTVGVAAMVFFSLAATYTFGSLAVGYWASSKVIALLALNSAIGNALLLKFQISSLPGPQHPTIHLILPRHIFDFIITSVCGIFGYYRIVQSELVQISQRIKDLNNEPIPDGFLERINTLIRAGARLESPQVSRNFIESAQKALPFCSAIEELEPFLALGVKNMVEELCWIAVKKDGINMRLTDELFKRYAAQGRRDALIRLSERLDNPTRQQADRQCELAYLLITHGRKGNQEKCRGENAALNAAIAHGAADLALLFIREGADINETPDSLTPLMKAILRGQSDVINRLLQEPKLRLDIRTPTGETPLHFASMTDNYDLVKELIEMRNEDLNTQNKCGRTPLFFACSPEVATLLVESGCNPQIPNARGDTPLEHHARRLDRLSIVLCLYARGERSERLGKLLAKAFYEKVMASQIPTMDTVQSLIDLGMELTGRVEGEKTLVSALRSLPSTPEREEILQLLIANGADPENSTT